MDDARAGDGGGEAVGGDAAGEQAATVRKVVVRRPPRQRSVPRRSMGARERRGERALTRLRRTFARRDEVLRTWGASLAPWRLGAVGVVIALVIAFAWIRLFHVGPPSVEDLRRASGVDEWRTLPIGVKDDQPGIAYRDPVTGIWSGFDIDIAYMIAEDLGFRRQEVQFFGIESEDRARMEATQLDGEPAPVKLVIASYSITEKREKMPNVMFTDSYLHTEQSVITLKGHAKVASLEEFKGKKVCTLSASTSADTASSSGAELVRRNRVSDCFKLLDGNQVDAVSTDAAILGGYKARNPDRYDHWDLGDDKTEAWGVSVGDNAALRDLVNLTLYRSYADPEDARWEQAYQDNIAPEAAANPGVPLARPQQPVTPRPEIRELPWENLAP
ncbi:transporter substrate-binding domain-containing protein [Couchioplanes caeruleus]|uniref:transporter substrate-binding domain-containing protein n=1 Tax=Couchioplanes caeruleus TaxID=56438 RepID=UPI0020BE72CC|nr:transporter substrate-binding domain-containing protein [Couchioplanes caeruleus]UQU67056.1 transporter substrate-binding domain-containing protein [Couchioplanes caeruleus]